MTERRLTRRQLLRGAAVGSASVALPGRALAHHRPEHGGGPPGSGQGVVHERVITDTMRFRDIHIIAGTIGASPEWYAGWVPNVVIDPTDSNATAQAKIDANPGGIIGFESGVHVERNIRPTGAAGLRFIGRADGSTVLDGSRDIGVTGWTNNGDGTWSKAVPGGISRSVDWGAIDRLYNTSTSEGLHPFTAREADQIPEELWVRTGTEVTDPFYDGYDGWKRLRRQITTQDNADASAAHIVVSAPGADEWVLYYDTYTPSNVVRIGTDPATFTEIRLSTQPYGVKGNDYVGLFLADLAAHRYANFTRDAPFGEQILHHWGWEYHYCSTWGNHGPGITASPAGSIYNCSSRFNGRFGLSGNDYGKWGQVVNDPNNNVPIEGRHYEVYDSDFSDNLRIDYNPGHGGGGFKLGAESNDSGVNPCIVQNSRFARNNHHGAWFDHAFEHNPYVARIHFLSNLVEGNAGRGVYNEIMSMAELLIRHNEIRNNGIGLMPGNIYGLPNNREAIGTTACGGVHALDNWCVDNMRGIRWNDADRTNNINKLGEKPRIVDGQASGNRVQIHATGVAEASDGRVSRWDSSFADDGVTGLADVDQDNNHYYIDQASRPDDFRYDAEHAQSAGGTVIGAASAMTWADWQAMDRTTTTQVDRNSTYQAPSGDPPLPDSWVPFTEQFYGAGSGLA